MAGYSTYLNCVFIKRKATTDEDYYSGGAVQTDYSGAVQTDPETAKGVSRHRKHIEVLCCRFLSF